jgi:F-type H+-transporting ATPase subunit b
VQTAAPAVRRVATFVAEAREESRRSTDANVGEALKSLVERKLNPLAIAAMNMMVAFPALANEEKGKIFDFNLTLPIIAVQFLLLMVALDNIWFKPVSKVMDDRDAMIRNKLMSVRDNSSELNALEKEAQQIIRQARIEITEQQNEHKKKLAEKLDAELQENRAKVEAELAAALADLEKQKEETLAGLESQVQALSEEIVKKVLPIPLPAKR